MYDQDERTKDDTLRVGRGIAYGVVLGALLWLLILAVVFWGMERL